MAEIEASRKTIEEHAQANEELRKANEELQRNMHRHDRRPAPEHSSVICSRDDPKPFSRQIMEKPIPPHYITPKIALFSGVEDPESHLKAFRAQMIIYGGSDVVRCKMLMDTFTGTIVQWFGGIPNDYITSFPQFSRMFKEQFPVNKVDLLRLHDLFDVKQREGELLKEYLNRFCAISMRLQTPNEEMVVVAFIKRMATSPFSDLLIRNRPETLSEVQERATTHIEAEEVVLRKNGSWGCADAIFTGRGGTRSNDALP